MSTTPDDLVRRFIGAIERFELEEALAAIARTAPKSTLVGDFPRLQNGAIRQITGMTVRFDA